MAYVVAIGGSWLVVFVGLVIYTIRTNRDSDLPPHVRRSNILSVVYVSLLAAALAGSVASIGYFVVTTR